MYDNDEEVISVEKEDTVRFSNIETCDFCHGDTGKNQHVITKYRLGVVKENFHVECKSLFEHIDLSTGTIQEELNRLRGRFPNAVCAYELKEGL